LVARLGKNSDLIDAATFKFIEDFALLGAVATVDATIVAKW